MAVAAQAAGAGPVPLPAGEEARTAGGGRVAAVGPTSWSPFDTGAVVTRELAPLALGDGTVLPALRVAYRHDGPGPSPRPVPPSRPREGSVVGRSGAMGDVSPV